MFAAKDELFTRPSGGYNIARSVRLRSSASAYFNRTPASASNRRTFTWSGWCKRSNPNTTNVLFSAYVDANNFFSVRLRENADNGRLEVLNYSTGYDMRIESTQVFRDPSAWYHFIIAVDTTQATSTNRVKLYLNGSQITALSTTTYPSQNFDTDVNNTNAHYIGSEGAGSYLDGYLTEINFVDGQALTPSSFGETDSITGVWKPKAYSGTYGTNGFYLNFSDNSNNTAATIGKDYSGNGNNWTPNNISVTAGVTYDSMQDVPTLTSATAANYAVLNPLDKNTSSITISDGNLKYATSGTNFGVRGSISVSSGKWYWETTITAVGTGSLLLGIANATWDLTYVGSTSGSYGYFSANGNKGNNTSFSAYGATFTTNDVIGIALDMDSGTLTFYKNNTSQGTAFTGLSGSFFPAFSGQTSDSAAVNFGQRPFSYTPPTGFVALNTYNLPTSTITNGAAYMAATLYTGTGASLTVANTVGSTSFQPDWVWAKSRSAATDHALYDSVRGVQKQIESNTTTAETTETTGLTAFGSTGFTVGALAQMNTSAATYVAWQWKAGTTSSSNTNGSITSTVSAGATQGFSVVTYTGTGVTATVGHGLGVAPSMIIVKNRAAAESWRVGHSFMNGGSSPWSYYMNLNGAGAQVLESAIWNNTAPTSTVFTISNDSAVSGNGQSHVAYCFSAVAGYSAFGSYIGNGTQGAGPFVFLGFRPRYVLVKNASVGGRDWHDYDSSRSPFNYSGSNILKPNIADAELTGRNDVQIDMLSNGFRLIGNDAGINESGATFIYMCFAENPFKNSLAR